MTAQTLTTVTSRTAAGARGFYLFMALACAAVAITGFTPTYFLRASTLPPMTLRAHVHGAVFTAWITLFVVQTALVRADRRKLHRTLGVFGAGLALAMLVVGTAAIFGVVPRMLAAHFNPHGMTPVSFMASQLGMLLQFGMFVALAIAWRRTPGTHKRLMLLATISILPPAVARMHLVEFPYSSTLIAYLLLLPCFWHDIREGGKPHAVTAWGTAAMLVAMVARVALGQTDAWERFGERLLN
jgi:hypothetical protein